MRFACFCTWQGPGCCSEFTVSYHYVTPEEMYLIEFLLYHTQIYGRHSTARDKEIFTDKEAVIADKAPNEVLLTPKYIWHYLYRYSVFEWMWFLYSKTVRGFYLFVKFLEFDSFRNVVDIRLLICSRNRYLIFDIGYYYFENICRNFGWKKNQISLKALFKNFNFI